MDWEIIGEYFSPPFFVKEKTVSLGEVKSERFNNVEHHIKREIGMLLT